MYHDIEYNLALRLIMQKLGIDYKKEWTGFLEKCRSEITDKQPKHGDFYTITTEVGPITFIWDSKIWAVALTNED